MRVILFIIPLGLVFTGPSLAANPVSGPISAEVLRVVDADTIAVSALIWPGQRIEIKVRLAGVNAPEIFRPACQQEKRLGQLATEFVEQNIGDQVYLTDIRLGKYAGRVVAQIRTSSGKDLGQLLLNAGLAKQQKDRKNWCKTIG